MTETMTLDLRREFGSALLDERQSLRQSLRLLGDSERMLGDSQATEGQGQQADVASDLAEQEVDLALEQSARQKLAEVEAALRRLSDGPYGMCDNCGRPIPIDRLRAVPWTTRCFNCS